MFKAAAAAGAAAAGRSHPYPPPPKALVDDGTATLLFDDDLSVAKLHTHRSAAFVDSNKSGTSLFCLSPGTGVLTLA